MKLMTKNKACKIIHDLENKLNRNMKDQEYLYQLHKCKGCHFVDQEALITLTPACTFSGQLQFDKNGHCVTRRVI